MARVDREHFFLSPHYDDPALSCGGLIAQLSAAGQRVTVATVFGGKPDYDHLSLFARAIHGRPLAGRDPIDQRRAEEQQALALLGAESRLGDFLDCIYRQDATATRWLYASEEALFGPLDPADNKLITGLAHWLAALLPSPARSILYAPLAIGNHVDHQIARRSAAILQDCGYHVLHYEDYPYVARDPNGLAKSLGSPPERSRWTDHLVSLTPADLQRKIEAVLAYASQLGVLFPGGDDPRERVSAALHSQAMQTGQGRLAERLWRLTPGRWVCIYPAVRYNSVC
jgi:LmbE family N-acetylglucosaminyl deacetylase